MNIAKTALVSTIALLIAMSAPAYSAGPSAAQQTDTPERQKARQAPRLPLTGKQACTTSFLTLPASGASTDTGLGITFFLGVPKAVALIFSSEVSVAAGGRVNLDYSIDGAAPKIIGPEFFSDDAIFTTRTAYGVVIPPFVPTVLSAGTHTITPFLRATGGVAGSADFRCFSILNTGV
jgi:hypothetical protein